MNSVRLFIRRLLDSADYIAAEWLAPLWGVLIVVAVFVILIEASLSSWVIGAGTALLGVAYVRYAVRHWGD